MKGLAISYKGMEDITELEVNELLKSPAEIKESCVIFDIKNMEDLAVLCYKGQAVNRILLLLDDFKINKIEDLKRISKIDFSEFIQEGKTFAVRSEIVENELDDSAVQKTTGDYIEGKVNLKNPDVTVFVYIHRKQCCVGIDFGGDLSKREYKIALCRNDLKGTVAYALTRIGGYEKGKSLLNYFCANGTIAIEAALFGSNISVNYFNKNKFPFLKFLDFNLEQCDEEKKEAEVYAFDQGGYVRLTKQNAKVAGVELKFEVSEKVDIVVANMKNKTKKDYEKLFSLNFKKLVVCSDKEILKKGGYKTEEREIKHGKETLKIVTFLKP